MGKNEILKKIEQKTNKYDKNVELIDKYTSENKKIMEEIKSLNEQLENENRNIFFMELDKLGIKRDEALEILQKYKG